MSIEFPDTFGEAFWGPQIDANKGYADATEKTLTPYVAGLLGLVSGLEGLPPIIEQMLSDIGTPGHFGLSNVADSVASTAANGAIGEGLSPFLRLLSYAINKAKPSKIIELDNAATLRYRGIMPRELYEDIGASLGFEPVMAQAIYRSLQPWPDVTDVIQWARYTYDESAIGSNVLAHTNMGEEEQPIFDFATRLRLTPNDIQALHVRRKLDKQQAEKELRKLGYYNELTDSVLDLAYSVPNSAVLLQSSLFRGEPFDINEHYVSLGGINPEYAPHFIDGMLTKPDPTMITRYLLRQDPNLNNLERELRRIGIHPDYLPMFKELAYPVPPIADLITMAVREAFSPEIASRFGQYEDYPQDLTKFAAMNGLSEEWAKRYWAAHWNLPSPQQGFEMLHRGKITQQELNLLLRALDVMPFWREKLIDISYNPLTRVDVRRMYALGVLNEAEIVKAYQDIGYTPENADRLRQFTVKQTTSSQSGLSVAKVVTAYKNGLTTRQNAYNTITRLGVRPNTISDILDNADIQLEWQRTKDGISSIRNLFKQERITENEARNRLQGLRLDGVKIDALVNQWVSDGEKSHGTLLTKTDVLSLHKKKLRTVDRARQEFSLLGYTTDRATLLIATIGE